MKNFKLTILNLATLHDPSPDLRDELVAEFTLRNPKYIEAKKFGRYFAHIPKTLHYCTETPQGLIMPRGALPRIMKIARKHGEVTLEDRTLALTDLDITFNGKLRPYQLKAMKEAYRYDMVVIRASTGAGKTVIGCALIAARHQPTIIIVHTRELLEQWIDRIKQFLAFDAGMIGGGRFEIRPVTVATVQTARKHLDKLKDRFGQIIVDECHRTPSSTFTECIKAFPARYVVGLSATPYRRDGLSPLIGWYCGLNRVEVSSDHLLETGAVLVPEIRTHRTEFEYLYNDDYPRMLSALVADKERNQQIAADIREASQDGECCLVVSDRIGQLKALQELSGCGVLLTGKTPAKARRQIVQDLQAGRIKVLFSTITLVGEGFDAPNFSSLFISSPIKYRGRLIQIAGRVLRPAPGKTAVIHDYCDCRQPVLNAQYKKRLETYRQIKGLKAA